MRKLQAILLLAFVACFSGCAATLNADCYSVFPETFPGQFCEMEPLQDLRLVNPVEVNVVDIAWIKAIQDEFTFEKILIGDSNIDLDVHVIKKRFDLSFHISNN